MNRTAARFLPAFVLAALLAAAATLRPDPPSANPRAPFVPPAGEAEEDPAPPPTPDRALEILTDRSADVDERVDALRAKPPLEAMRRVLFDPSEPALLRSGILLALGRSADPDALEILRDFSRAFPDFPGRHVLVKALDDLEPVVPEARLLLREALRSERSEGARSHAARALESPPPSEPDRSLLRDAVLGDPSENVKLAALGALIRAGGEEDFCRTVADLPGAPVRVRALASRGK